MLIDVSICTFVLVKQVNCTSHVAILHPRSQRSRNFGVANLGVRDSIKPVLSQERSGLVYALNPRLQEPSGVSICTPVLVKQVN